VFAIFLELSMIFVSEARGTARCFKGKALASLSNKLGSLYLAILKFQLWLML
jgi:hypothetical protein